MKSRHFEPMTITPEVSHVVKTLKDSSFEAFLVGGCVRDVLIGRTPKDWDITTNATPEQIMSLFEKTFYENSFGTVGVVIKKQTGSNGATSVTEESQLREENAFGARLDQDSEIIEVTPYRLESAYTDGRRPDEVTFSKNLLDDLKRRDFTINAIALDIDEGTLVDPYKGQEDLSSGTIRAVGDPRERFAEDGLRIMRCVRLAAELGFMINQDTEKAVFGEGHMLEKIAEERIRDEFSKLLMSKNPMVGIILAERMGILKYIVPELREALQVKQNRAHSYDVFEHLLRSLQHAADKDWPLEIRLAALFHDIAKPSTKRITPEGDITFYGHEVVGARMTKTILERLKYSKKTIENVVKLVRWHMFFSDTEQISLSAVRRMIVNVGKEHIWDLMNLRICDRVGTGRPKENPYRFRKYKAMLEEAMRDPISVGMLKIDGKELMEVLHMEPGRRIGYLLNALLEEVLEDPTKNTREDLIRMAQKLNILDEHVLKEKAEAGEKAKKELEEASVGKIREKYHVKQ